MIRVPTPGAPHVVKRSGVEGVGELGPGVKGGRPPCEDHPRQAPCASACAKPSAVSYRSSACHCQRPWENLGLTTKEALLRPACRDLQDDPSFFKNLSYTSKEFSPNVRYYGHQIEAACGMLITDIHWICTARGVIPVKVPMPPQTATRQNMYWTGNRQRQRCNDDGPRFVWQGFFVGFGMFWSYGTWIGTWKWKTIALLLSVGQAQCFWWFS